MNIQQKVDPGCAAGALEIAVAMQVVKGAAPNWEEGEC